MKIRHPTQAHDALVGGPIQLLFLDSFEGGRGSHRTMPSLFTLNLLGVKRREFGNIITIYSL